MKTLFLAFVLLAIGFNLANALGEAPDEDSHFGVIRNYIRRGLLQGGHQHEAFQPPLYYVLGSLLARPFDLSEARLWRNPDFVIGDPNSPPNLLIHTAAEDWPFAPWVWAWRILRFYSTLCVLIGLLATWKLARLVAPEEPLAGFLAVGLIGLSPGVLFVAAAVNNDNLAFALAALTLWQIARIVHGSDARRDWMLLGALLGAGYATKLSLLTLAAPTLIAWCLRAYKSAWARPLLSRAGYLAMGIAITGGWWALYLWVNHQEVIGLNRTWGFNPPRNDPILPSGWVAILLHTWRSYWLSYLQLRQPAWVYYGAWLLPILAVVGWIRRWRRRETSLDSRVLVVLAAQILAMGAAWLFWTTRVPGTDQARLLAPAYPAIAVLASMGMVYLWPRPWMRKLGVVLICFGLAGISLWTIFGVLRPHFAPPPTELAPSAPPQIAFGGELGLDYRITMEAIPLQIGQRIEIEARWRALAPIHRDLWVQWKLQPLQGDPLVVAFKSPSRGLYSTDRWPLGRVIRAHHTIVIPEGARPGVYRLIASVRPPDKAVWLPVLVEGQVIGEEIVLAEVMVVTP
ncbi:MAG: glycosyltransferase family 39 protein [Anaerolineae bacterium]|nr:glycosyltransferase family 39 protein [Anaerolineae bacterium]